MIRNRRTRIVATLGPVSRDADSVLELAKTGVDVFRLNFSHGSYDDHQLAFDNVRAAELAIGRPLGILADLQGPKIRLGKFKNGEKVKLEDGQTYRFELGDFEGDISKIPLPQPEIFAVMKKNLDLLIDDGKVRVRIVDFGKDWADVKTIRGGFISDRKGVNVPGAILPISALTEKDRKDWLANPAHEAPLERLPVMFCSPTMELGVDIFKESMFDPRREVGGTSRQGHVVIA